MSLDRRYASEFRYEALKQQPVAYPTRSKKGRGSDHANSANHRMHQVESVRLRSAGKWSFGASRAGRRSFVLNDLILARIHCGYGICCIYRGLLKSR